VAIALVGLVSACATNPPPGSTKTEPAVPAPAVQARESCVTTDNAADRPTTAANAGTSESAETEEYTQSLRQLYSFFESTSAQQLFCTDRFPESRAALTAAYQRWETTHSALNREVNELFLQHALRMAGNNQDGADRILDVYRQAIGAHVRARSPEQIRATCEGLPACLASEQSDPAARLPKALATVRAQTGKDER
jgi:flagellar hook-length control protein FliK